MDNAVAVAAIAFLYAQQTALPQANQDARNGDGDHAIVDAIYASPVAYQ